MAMNKQYKDAEWLRRQYLSGKKQREIAAECGVTRGTIQYWMDKASIAPRPRASGAIRSEKQLHRSRTWLRKQYRSGKTTYDIAELAGVSQSTIHDWMNRFGIKLIPAGHATQQERKWDIEEIARMREEGKTLQEIGNHFGVSRQAIHQALKSCD